MSNQLFLKNKYRTWYFNIINNAKRRKLNYYAYLECHHIIPSSFKKLKLNEFNFNFKNNLVFLTAKEHYICHLLLTKFCTGQNKHKMIYAFNYMKTSPNNNGEREKVTGIMFQYNKIKVNKLQKKNKLYGKDNGSYGNIWVYHLEKEENLKIPKVFLNDYISLGYIKGRCIDFNKRKKDIEKDFLKKQKKLDNKLRKYKIFKQKFKYFQQYGWECTKQKFKLNYTRQNLIHHFNNFELNKA